MALGSPMAVFADDGETAVVAENTVQAKKTDGSEVFVSVSDYVRGMMERGAVRLNDETGYLEDTSTGQKVDPETGERLTETPAIPDNPGNEENPETPENQRLRKPRRIQKFQRLQKNRIHRKIQRHRKTRNSRKAGYTGKSRDSEKPETQKSRIARIPANPIPKIRFRNRILIRQILPKTGKIQRPTQFREVRSTIHRRSAKQKKQTGQNESKTAVSNSELINRQQIVKRPEMVEDFRFWTVARKYAFARTAINVREEIPEAADGRADTSEEAKEAELEAAKKMQKS